MASRLRIGKADRSDPDSPTAPIFVDGTHVGDVETVMGERFESVSSRHRVRYVDHYEVQITADDENWGIEFKTPDEVKAYIKRYFGIA